MGKLSPMMQHYLATKEEYKDCILFYRLGDFYEMFFDDAVTVSRELELTLTGKDCGMEERAPMCGVPFHAYETYMNRLVQKGYKVAIAEQMEDPKLAKGLVKREVIKVVTPGTNTSITALEEGRNNYLMCVAYMENSFGIAAADISTGDFYVTEVSTLRTLNDEIAKYTPSELICNDSLSMSGIDFTDLRERLHISITTLENRYFDDFRVGEILKEHFHISRIDGLGLGDYPSGTIASGALLMYLHETQKDSVSQLTEMKTYRTGKYMVLDSASRRNLELTETLREKNKRGSLLWVLDHTRTAMGARMLRTWITQPLIDMEEILRRQDALEEINERPIDREEMREYLGPVYDLERLISRMASKTANPRDMIAFRNSLQMLPPILEIMKGYDTILMTNLREDMDPLEDICSLITQAIVDDPPMTVREGGMIREGFNQDADMFRRASTEGKTWLLDLEAREREKTGIKNLRIKYNKVFGYYLEVTNSFKDQVPDYYIRKQTLTTAERYTTDELKKMEDTILGAEDKLNSLEYDLFCQVRDRIAADVSRIQKTAKAVAALDVLLSLALVSERGGYVRPKMNIKGIIDIKDGRHPVVEKMMPDGQFVANDVFLNNGAKRVSIITGPNMAGKSTYMRQAALLVLMAQIGCFVPASSANISICDRIFTRVGASDDLASGQSTFMVEMTEVANILRNATKNSLLILDEIGRGTSTYDGLSIAWAVIEYISNTRILGAKTLFATHYHELTELEGKIPGVNNYCIAVRENGDDIIFLRKIVKGGADKSYGIQVARLAGVPEQVLERAKELVELLTESDMAVRTEEAAASVDGSRLSVKRPDDVDMAQMTLFDTVEEDQIIKELTEADLSRMTPIDALNYLYQIQSKLKNRI